MKTWIVKAENDRVEEKDMKKLGEIIAAGGLVAFPTETVYGLGASAFDENAASKIYAAKGRPSDNPLIVHISDYSELDTVVREIPKGAELLFSHFSWPLPAAFCAPYNTGTYHMGPPPADCHALTDNFPAGTLLRKPLPSHPLPAEYSPLRGR